ncbi:MAG TPA: hypothetical protein VL463_20590 [Kofleriaceae bacterium]|nr:hypothetical protein [Kofleriaceae bacterium]
MRAVGCLLYVCACSAEPATIMVMDAGPPDAEIPLLHMSYDLYVFNAEPFERPAPAIAPVVYIDGVPRRSLSIVYTNELKAIGAKHVVELRYDDHVIASYALTIERTGCLNPLTIPIAASYSQALCEYDSGDLRFASDEAMSVPIGNGGATCVGDGTCRPCGGCVGDPHLRCGLRVESTTPFASRLDCAPRGTKQLGEACTFIDDPDGAYDDCAADLFCVEGTCRASCASGMFVDGYPPEVRVCQ